MGASQFNPESKPEDFLESLSAFSKQHRAQHVGRELSGNSSPSVVPVNPGLLRWCAPATNISGTCFSGMAVHCRAATLSRRGSSSNANCSVSMNRSGASSTTSRPPPRIPTWDGDWLLLLGPPSGGKSTMAILLKRGLEEYSRTDEGAIYAVKGSPLRESPLNLIPISTARGVSRNLRGRYQR